MEYRNIWELDGLKKGRIEGERKGKLDGKLEAKRETTLKLLTRQIGPVSPTTQKRINKLPLELLDELFDAAFDFDKKAALNEWLRKHACA